MSTDNEPRETSQSLSNVLEGLIKELARTDRRTMQRVQRESDLAQGDRPTYRVADVSVELAGRASGDAESLSLVQSEFDVRISFSVRETFGGDLLG